jgi:hypothetical protein
VHGIERDVPGDMFRPSNFICRPSAGICDVQETCTGTSAPCPADAVQPTTTFCARRPGRAT